MLVIGIDPGSRHTGYGIVSEVSGVLKLVTCGVINPPLKASFSARLGFIYKGLLEVIEGYHPQTAAIEQVFTAHNAASALKLGQARGAAIAACASKDLEVSDYEPLLVKKTLVGVGRAEKEQVRFMVGKLLNTKADWTLDTSDALAVAICHLTMERYKKLIKNNP